MDWIFALIYFPPDAWLRPNEGLIIRLADA